MAVSNTAQKNAHSSPQEIVEELGRKSKAASRVLAQTSPEQVNAFLQSLEQAILAASAFIIQENEIDLKNAEEKQLSSAMIDRLKLDETRIKALADSVSQVKDLECSTGKILWENTRPNGLKIKRVSCPIGVLGMIYESRPNVTLDAAILCLKSHNAVILRGGSESLHTSLAIHKIIEETLIKHDLPEGCVSIIPTPDREAVGAMLRADQYIDVMIPRGGKNLIERIRNEARMPVFSHLDGICHIYVDHESDIEIAKNVTLNAKMRRTGICGAMETLLLDQSLPSEKSSEILKNILDEECTILGDENSQKLDNRILPANEEDWSTEYLDAKLSVKFVTGVKEAVEHINQYGSHHTDSIITTNQSTADYFQHNVDSGIVMHNASTQFADGGEFGMGAEIGIATGKMHARGPVGLEQLCSYKYIVSGTGQTRPK